MSGAAGRLKMVAIRLLDRVTASPYLQRPAARNLAAQDLFVLRFAADHAIAYDPSDVIGREIAAKGDYERDSARALVAMLRREGLLAGDTALLEVGANIGTHSVYLMLEHPFARLVAVEPDPRNVAVLRANLRLNGLDGRADILEIGAGAAEAALELHRHPRNRGGSTLRAQDLGAFAEHAAERVTVRVARLDDVLPALLPAGLPVGLVWMDVEGFELQALRGMRGLLAARPPLFFEYSPRWLSGAERAEILDDLLGGYSRLFVWRDGGFAPIDRAACLGLGWQANLLALP